MKLTKHIVVGLSLYAIRAKTAYSTAVRGGRGHMVQQPRPMLGVTQDASWVTYMVRTKNSKRGNFNLL